MFDTELMAATATAESQVDRRARLRLVADRVAPLALAHQRTLPLLPAVSELFVGGSLQRGTTVEVNGIGATSLSLVLAAGPSQAGSWTALVGAEGLGLAAVAEAGIALERLLVVSPVDSSTNVGVVAALIGAVDVVMVGPGLRFRPADLRRLSARLRESGSVLIQIGSSRIGSSRIGSSRIGSSQIESSKGPGVDVGVRVMTSQWSGLGDGHGLLRSRKVEVQTQGRGAATRTRAVSLLLPGPNGAPMRPDTPVCSEVPECPDTPVCSDVPECPDTPVCSDVPECPDTPVCSDVPECPDMPVCSDVPECPDMPVCSDVPECPDMPVCSDVPECPDMPVCSDVPECPDMPVCSDVPECPDMPVCSEVPECPDTPVCSDVPECPDVAAV